jgi:hypothetical protein
VRSLAFLSLLAGLVASPALAQDLDFVQEVETEALTPGAAAGPVLGEHRFVLYFEQSSIREAGLIRSKFEKEGIFAEILDDLADQIALPVDIPVNFADCGGPNAYWSPSEQSITFCYELIVLYNDTYQNLEGPEGGVFRWADQDSVLTGTTLFVLLHELGHGLTALYDLPITGREEDAVDQFAALTLIGADEEGDSFEERPSRIALLGAYFFKELSRAPESFTRDIFSNEHSLGQQRYYDVMCLVLGSDMDTYAPILTPGLVMVFDTVEKNPESFDQDKVMDWLNKTDALNILPAARALRCPHEFARYDASWDYIVDTFMTVQAD